MAERLQYYQIKSGYEQFLKPEDFIVIKCYLNGAMRFWCNEIELGYSKLSRKPVPPSKTKQYYQVKGPADRLLLSKNARKNKGKTPWGHFNPSWIKSA